MNQQDCAFKIKKKNLKAALAAVRALAGKETIRDGSGRHFSWVNQGFEKLPTLEAIMKEWRWEIQHDEQGNVEGVQFLGEKLGDDEILWKALAPFVEAGSFIEMSGEDDAHWRWVFDGESVEEKSGRIVWDE